MQAVNRQPGEHARAIIAPCVGRGQGFTRVVGQVQPHAFACRETHKCSNLQAHPSHVLSCRHAGYRYCGHVMAHAYKFVDPTKVWVNTEWVGHVLHTNSAPGAQRDKAAVQLKGGSHPGPIAPAGPKAPMPPCAQVTGVPAGPVPPCVHQQVCPLLSLSLRDPSGWVQPVASMSLAVLWGAHAPFCRCGCSLAGKMVARCHVARGTWLASESSLAALHGTHHTLLSPGLHATCAQAACLLMLRCMAL